MKYGFRFLSIVASILTIASAAAADFTLDLLWNGTDSAVSAGAGDTLTLEFYLTATNEDIMLSGIQFSLLWDTAELSAVSGTLNNPGPTGQGGVWINGGAGEAFLDNDAGELLAGISTSTIVYQGGLDSVDLITFGEGPIFIGSLTFLVVTPTSDSDLDVIACFNCGSIATGDGVTGNDATSAYVTGITEAGTVNGATLNNPEPSTASLLGLGLVALVATRRRAGLRR